jgi:hypothetical protein
MSDNNTGVAYYTYSPICGGGNDFEGRLGLHIAAIFVILVTSSFGNSLPKILCSGSFQVFYFLFVPKSSLNSMFPILRSHLPNSLGLVSLLQRLSSISSLRLSQN